MRTLQSRHAPHSHFSYQVLQVSHAATLGPQTLHDPNSAQLRQSVRFHPCKTCDPKGDHHCTPRNLSASPLGWETFEDSVRTYLQCPKPRVARWRQLNIQICQSSSQRRLTEGTRNRSENHRGHGRRGAIAQSAAALRPPTPTRQAAKGPGRSRALPRSRTGASGGTPRPDTPRGAEAAKPAPAPRTNPLSPRRDRAAREETPLVERKGRLIRSG